MGKRKNFTDNMIIDAMEACNHSIRKASERLGVTYGTLSKWITESDNLRGLIALKLSSDACKARDLLGELLGLINNKSDLLEDTKQQAILVTICKIFLDKFESNKSSIEMDSKSDYKINLKLDEQLKNLLGETKDGKVQ